MIGTYVYFIYIYMWSLTFWKNRIENLATSKGNQSRRVVNTTVLGTLVNPEISEEPQGFVFSSYYRYHCTMSSNAVEALRKGTRNPQSLNPKSKKRFSSPDSGHES